MSSFWLRGFIGLLLVGPLTAQAPTPDRKQIAEWIKELGATIHLEPAEIPTVGWIAVLQDPVGAAFGLFKPSS